MSYGVGGSDCISHFLRMSGHGKVVDEVRLLLLTATTRLTQDLLEFTAMAEMSQETCEASALVVDKIRKVLTEIATASAKTTDLSFFRGQSSLKVFCCGSVASFTALEDSDLDVTIVQDVVPGTRYFMRRKNTDDLKSKKSLHVEGFIRLRQVGSEFDIILLPYYGRSLALPLLDEEELLSYVRHIITDQLQIEEKNDDMHCNNCGTPAFNFRVLDSNVNISITVNQRHSVEVSKVLRNYLDSNKLVRPVIIFMKTVLKACNVTFLHLSPYILTLMVVAFSKYCSHVFPSFSFPYYPHRREMVEPGYLLFSFLSFFSPLPRGQFDPREMVIDPLHPRGIIHKANNGCNSHLLGEDSQEQPWIIMEPSVDGCNAAASCVLIHHCRKLFENILLCLLKGYISGGFCAPFQPSWTEEGCVLDFDVCSAYTAEGLPIHNFLNLLLLNGRCFSIKTEFK